MKFREPRAPCNQPVTVFLGDRRLPGTVVNISPSGARLAQVPGLLPGDRLRLDPGPGCPLCEAEVRWTSGPHAGLRFAKPLDARSIAVVRKAGSGCGPQRAAGWNLSLRELR
ncbi:MAG: PilZ domain-containing protein [Rhodobacter sp.]|nr:PilZ domain-containing protein [Paracoccaceae bacterium]MCC0078254.1 PilZ domain-containing protein [Rhodobacter sp.]